MSNTNSGNNTTIIAQQSITWWLRGDGAPTELDETSVEHIQGLLDKEFREGELCVIGADGQTEFRGWWQLDPEAPKLLTPEEAVKDISEVLLENDELLAIIYNQVCNGTLEYKGDSIFELTSDE